MRYARCPARSVVRVFSPFLGGVGCAPVFSYSSHIFRSLFCAVICYVGNLEPFFPLSFIGAGSSVSVIILPSL